MHRTLKSLAFASTLAFIFSAKSNADENLGKAELAKQHNVSQSWKSSSSGVESRDSIYTYQRFRNNRKQRFQYNPKQIYRNGQYGRFFGDYYRDRNGGFFYGYDSRYRFGIHR